MTTPKVGDPDPTIHHTTGGCEAQHHDERGFFFTCTRMAGHQDAVPGGDHVAGDGTEVAAVWPSASTAEGVLALLSHPDAVNTTGYRAAYEAVEGALADGDHHSHPLLLAITQAEASVEEAQSVVRALREAAPSYDDLFALAVGAAGCRLEGDLAEGEDFDDDEVYDQLESLVSRARVLLGSA
jgi:hypothetical protein